STTIYHKMNPKLRLGKASERILGMTVSPYGCYLPILTRFRRSHSKKSPTAQDCSRPPIFSQKLNERMFWNLVSGKKVEGIVGAFSPLSANAFALNSHSPTPAPSPKPLKTICSPTTSMEKSLLLRSVAPNAFWSLKKSS